MLRGSIIIFTGILSVSIRNCDSLSTNKFDNIIGSLLACVGLVMVSREKHMSHHMKAMQLTLASQNDDDISEFLG